MPTVSYIDNNLRAPLHFAQSNGMCSDPPPAFNVTIRSDRRGTCKGTHMVFACVGYCESSAFPSRYSVLVASNFTHNITSASRCCTISRDAKVSRGERRPLSPSLVFSRHSSPLLCPPTRSKCGWTAPEVDTTT